MVMSWVGPAIGALAGVVRTLGPFGIRYVTSNFMRTGPSVLRSRQVIQAGLFGTGAAAVQYGVTQVIEKVDEMVSPVMTPNGGIGAVTQRTFPSAPQTVGQIVTPGPVPVTFVRAWRAGAALFAIDSEGRRWAWRPKLGIWKRTRVYRNIVISTKDISRARRLVRTSKRLNALRKSL